MSTVVVVTVEAGVAEHLGGGVGVVLVEVGEHDVLAGADPSGDGLADRAGADDDDDVAHDVLLSVLLVVSWDEADGDVGGGGADDGADDARPVAVVLGVVGGVDRVVHAGSGRGEGDVALDAAGADPAGAAGDGSPVPAVVGSVGGADVHVVADADDPHRHERPQRAVGRVGGELELLGGADRGRARRSVQVAIRRCRSGRGT